MPTKLADSYNKYLRKLKEAQNEDRKSEHATGSAMLKLEETFSPAELAWYFGDDHTAQLHALLRIGDELAGLREAIDSLELKEIRLAIEKLRTQ